MIPPTSIDGTDITGATIDGTDVQEITVDGDVVFSAESLPVAYSNLVAWYPFDSAEYGGSNSDDMTALFNPAQSGDSTAYDGTVNGVTHQSSGGVTDINAGTNSGAFESFTRQTSNNITVQNVGNAINSEVTVTAWAKGLRSDDLNNYRVFQLTDPNFFEDTLMEVRGNDFGSPYRCYFFGHTLDIAGGFSDDFVHVAGTISPNQFEFYYNGVLAGSQTTNQSITNPTDLIIMNNNNFNRSWDGKVDDVRVYDKVLTTSEIESIVQNTQDPNNPVFP